MFYTQGRRSGQVPCHTGEGTVPIEVSYEKQGAGVVVVCTGSISGAEIRETNASLYASPERIAALRYQIWDLTGVTHLDVTNDDLREFAMQDMAAARTNPNMVNAIVGDPQLFRGYDKVFSVYTQTWSRLQTGIFSTVDEARSWIASLLPELEAIE
jgi:hypothetical protein